MERARATWTDERLDDLARWVDDGFNRVDQDIRALRADMNARFDAQDARMNARFDAQDARFDVRFQVLEARIDALQRTMLAMMGTILVGFAALIATQL